MKISLPIPLRAALLAAFTAVTTLTGNFSIAAGVAILPNDASTSAEAKQLLAAPSLGPDSSYTLTETNTETLFSLIKYVYDSDTQTVSEVIYHMSIKDLGDATGDIFDYSWYTDSDGNPFLDRRFPPASPDFIVISSRRGPLDSSTLIADTILDASFIVNIFDPVGTASGAALRHDNASVKLTLLGDFVGNGYAIDNSTANIFYAGGAIANSQTITGINSHFASNRLEVIFDGSTTTYTANTYGGAISNTATGMIGDTVGDFISNRSITYSKGFVGDDNKNENIAISYAGAIYNQGEMGKLTGDFIANRASAQSVVLHYSDGSNAYGGAIYNGKKIGDITGDFMRNQVEAITEGGFALAYGGAIMNDAELGNITGDFVNNSTRTEGAVQAFSAGGALNSHVNGSIGEIKSNFAGNSASAVSNAGNVYALGGASYNVGSITSVTGYFVQNSATAEAKAYANASGGAFYNAGTIDAFSGDFAYNSLSATATDNAAHSFGTGLHNAIATITATTYSYGDIERVEANFYYNTASATSTNASASSYGAGIYNISTMGDIVGHFVENSTIATSTNAIAYAMGAGIYNTDSITSVEGDFISNSTLSSATAGGSAIRNSGTITRITGNFFTNTATGGASGIGGALYNSGEITNITGDFVQNSVQGDTLAHGGALYNSEASVTLSSSFIGNYASSANNAEGGALYNTSDFSSSSIAILALTRSIEFTGNYTTDGTTKSSSAIYNASGLGVEQAKISLNAYGEHEIVINDAISGKSEIEDLFDPSITTPGSEWQSLNINDGLDAKGNTVDAKGAAFSTVQINNCIEYQTVNVHAGTLILGEYAGGSYTVAGQTHQVEASHAALCDSVLNIMTGAHTITNASYLAEGLVTNDGELTLTGGTLDTQDGQVAGTGKINLKDVIANNVTLTTTHLTMDWTGSQTAADFGALHSSATGSLTLNAGSVVELSITQTRPIRNFSWTILKYEDTALVTDHQELEGMLKINGESLEESGFILLQGADGLSYTLTNTLLGPASFSMLSMTVNGLSGNILLDQVNQQPGVEGQDLSAVMDEVYMSYTAASGVSAEGDRLAAAAAGAGVTSLGSAMMSSMEMQLQRMLQRSGSLLPVSKGNFWITGEGSLSELESKSTFAGHKLHSWGGSLGAEYGLSDDTSISVGLTALYGDLDAQSVDQATGDLDAYYLSAAALHKSGKWLHQGFVSAGLLDASLDRRVSHAGGSYSTSGDTSGYSVGVMYELGYEIKLRESTSLIPVFNAALMHGSLDGYTETGGDAALRVDDMDNTYATFGVGARLSNTSSTGIKTTARALFKLDAGRRQQSAGVSFRDVAETHSTMYGEEASDFGVELGLGAIFPVGANSAVFFDGTAEIRRQQHTFSGAVGYRLSF